jgi:hypothetical protein
MIISHLQSILQVAFYLQQTYDKQLY